MSLITRILPILTSLFLMACSFQLLTQTSQAEIKPNLPKLSVQLHSVKDAIIADFEGTLKTLASTGIEGVEFAGRFGKYENDAQGLKNFLTSIGLQASGAHVNIKLLRGEAYERTVNFYKTLGTNLLIIPHDGRVDKSDKVAELAQEMSEISKKLAADGMVLGYHNHAKEFKPFNDSTFWDYLALNTPNDMALQLDVGWANFAKVDSVEYVKRYPNRTLTTHIKIRTELDKNKMDKIDDAVAIVIGKDSYDWATLVKTMMAHGGTQWLVVEQEETHAGKSRLETVTASIKGLQAIVKNL